MLQTRYIFNFGCNLGINDDFEKEKKERCIRKEKPFKPKKNDKEKNNKILLTYAEKCTMNVRAKLLLCFWYQTNLINDVTA